MKFKIKINILIFLLLLCAVSFANDNKKILVMHSYHKGFYWTDSITNGIDSVFGGKKDVDIYFEYLDLKRNTNKSYIDRLSEFYNLKYKDIKFDGIIISDNLALNFIVKNRKKLFNNIPIVFCGINNFEEKLLHGEKKITGIVERADYRGTLDLMIKLHPDAEEVLVVTDTTFTGNEIKKEINRIIPEYKARFDFEIMDNYTILELEEKLTSLPEKTLVFALVMNKSRDGNFISYERGAELLAKSEMPVYLGWEFYFGKGAVGGKITSGFLQGQIASQMLSEIFNGADPYTMGIKTQFTSEYKLDYNALKKFEIEKSVLPEQVIIANKPRSFLEKNIENFVLGSFAVLFLIFILIFKLRFNMKKKNEKVEHSIKLERKIAQRTIELEEVNKKIMEQQSKLVKQAYNEGFSRVKSGIIHNIGNVVNPLHIAMQEEINYREIDKEHEIRFFEEVLYAELIKTQISTEKKEKIIKVLPEILKAMKDKKNAEFNRLKYCQKEIEHLKSIIRLQKNYLGTLGTESYFAVNELLKEVIDKRDFDYKLNLELELHSVEKVLCDRVQIIQVFDNIIKNQADDLLSSEKVYKLLRITTEENEKNVIVKFKDNGEAYPESFVRNIFDLSFITKEKNRKNFELYGCYQIIKKYGGNITLESDPRNGNIFTIFIPK